MGKLSDKISRIQIVRSILPFFSSEPHSFDNCIILVETWCTKKKAHLILWASCVAKSSRSQHEIVLTNFWSLVLSNIQPCKYWTIVQSENILCVQNIMKGKRRLWLELIPLSLFMNEMTTRALTFHFVSSATPSPL